MSFHPIVRQSDTHPHVITCIVDRVLQKDSLPELPSAKALHGISGVRNNCLICTHSRIFPAAVNPCVHATSIWLVLGRPLAVACSRWLTTSSSASRGNRTLTRRSCARWIREAREVHCFRSGSC